MPDTGHPLTDTDWSYAVLEAVEAIRQAILSDPQVPVRTAEEEWHLMSRAEQATLLIDVLNERANRGMLHELFYQASGTYRYPELGG